MFAVCSGPPPLRMAPNPGLCLFRAYQQAGTGTGSLQERPHQSLDQRAKPSAHAKPVHLFSWIKWPEEKQIQTHISKRKSGKFPFCLRWSPSPRSNKLFLCGRNQPINNNASYHKLRFQNEDNQVHGDVALSILKVVVLQAKSQAFETPVFSLKSGEATYFQHWLCFHEEIDTLLSLWSQGKGLSLTLLAFEDNTLPGKVAQNTQKLFSLYFFPN